MILVDANLLLYAKIADLPQHRPAAHWFESQLREQPRVGLPWPSLLGFLRISTSPRLFEQPLPVAEAWDQVQEWLALRNVWIPLPTDQHAAIMGDLLVAANAGANLVPDAHLAALALEHGLVVCSSDADFARFPAVRWRNPLAAK
jgi:toxin-antitoxin system PIN domain toxin